MLPESRRISFEHDGHRFEGEEQVGPGPARSRADVHWVIRMDGKPALEFRGPYPYRDADVKQRVLEWYGIQKR